MTKSAYVFASKFVASDAQQYVKSARIRSYSDRYFPAFGLNTPFLSLSLSLSLSVFRVRVNARKCGPE